MSPRRLLRTCGNASTGCACDTPVLAFARKHGGAGKKKNEGQSRMAVA